MKKLILKTFGKRIKNAAYYDESVAPNGEDYKEKPGYELKVFGHVFWCYE